MNMKKRIICLSMLSTMVLSATPVFAASNLPTEINNTKSVQNIITPPIVMIISNNQPGAGFSGTLWCTADAVYIRNATPGCKNTICGTLTYGQSHYFEFVQNGKAYWTDSMTGNLLSVDIRYLSTIPV